MLKIAVSTLSKRRSIIDDITGKGLLPFLNTNIGIISSQKIPLMINLTGINEAINNILDSESTDKEKTKLAGKILDTANEEIAKFSKKTGEEFGLSLIRDDSSERFTNIDIEKFGKSRVKSESNYYSQSITINHNELEKVDQISTYINKFKGGYSIYLDTSNISSKKFIGIMKKMSNKISYFKFYNRMKVCISCTVKNTHNTDKCKNCNSTSLEEYPTR